MRSLTIIIPACNEELLIGRTLNSVRCAIERLRAARADLKVDVLVGADGCTDDTAARAREAGAEIVEFPAPIGKWKVLLALIGRSRSDVVVLTDCGSVWPESLLEEVGKSLRDGSVMAVAPSYSNIGAGALERLLWAFERWLKGLESAALGPVSIHGATVAYRRSELLAALSRLDPGVEWLNDDVVVPVLLHTQFPSKRIEYLHGVVVEDYPPEEKRGFSAEFARRRRMVAGNGQWIAALLPPLWRANQTSGLLALRRVCRVLWAYWAFALAAGLCIMLLGERVGSAIVVLGALATVAAGREVSPAARICGAVAASIVSPYYLIATHRSREVVWE